MSAQTLFTVSLTGGGYPLKLACVTIASRLLGLIGLWACCCPASDLQAAPANSSDGAFSLELPAGWSSSASKDFKEYVLWVDDSSEGGSVHRFSARISSAQATADAAAQTEYAREVRGRLPASALHLEKLSLGKAGAAFRLTARDYDSLFFLYGGRVYSALSHAADREKVLRALGTIGPPREIRPAPRPQPVLKMPWGGNRLISQGLCDTLEASRRKTDEVITLLCWIVVGFFILAATWAGALFVLACAQTFFLLPFAVGLVMPPRRGRWHVLWVFLFLALAGSIVPDQMTSSRDPHLCVRMILGYANAAGSALAVVVGLALRDAFEKRRRLSPA